MNKNMELIPGPDRLINSLRDVGYNFPIAVADIVDNAIDANANEIAITFDFEKNHPSLCIEDNGLGMTNNELLEAMRFGSEFSNYRHDGLGKFGLGLKTASISQCRKLIVASRSNKNSKEINAYCWDLDHIKTTNKWEVLKVEIPSLSLRHNDAFDNVSGTTVIWQNLDRIFDKDDSEQEYVAKIASLGRYLEKHLSMVFHRFLSGEVSGKKIKILLNGNNVDPWDPFSQCEQFTKKMSRQEFNISVNDSIESISIQPYILPPQNKFSSRSAFTRASGPNKWNRQQGFYIYRANRLIQSGGWCGLRTLDEHTKLARIALDFSPVVDNAFKINISKMKVELPSQISSQIDEAIKPILKNAQDEYRKGNARPLPPVVVTPRPNPRPQDSTSRDPNGQNGTESETQIAYSFPQKTWSFDEFEKFFLEQTREVEYTIVKPIFQRIRKRYSR